MTPIERSLRALEELGCNPKPRGSNNWMAKCPAHDDHNPSLSITVTSDGKVLLKCHAGCAFEAIVQALRLQLRDLFPPTSDPGAKPAAAPRNSNPVPPAGQVFDTEALAIAALERKHGKPTRSDFYQDAEGRLVGVVLRFDGPRGKTYRPVSKFPDGWRIAAMPEPQPLYRLPELAKSARIVVCEGEKAADWARLLGFVATTSAGGAQAPEKTDWTLLAGKEVWILPDNDPPGRKYAQVVAGILSRLTPPATVRIVELPGLPEGGDIVDWTEARRGTAKDALRAEIERLAEATPPWQPPAQLAWQPGGSDDGAELTTLAYHPPPLDVLPAADREYVSSVAQCIGCDPAFVLLPVLVVGAGAIGGNTCRLELKRGWQIPPILWGAIIGESGTGKTPALQQVLKPIYKLQQEAFDRHKALYNRYEAELALWEKAHADWRRNGNTQQLPPEKPQPPVPERFIVSDVTVEALAPILLENPRGLLLATDELSAWISAFDRYANRGRVSTDAAAWLKIFNAGNVLVDRKTASTRTLYVPRAAVSVIGGIQPGILWRVLGREHREDGLLARLLLTYPPQRPRRWTKADIPPELEAEFAERLKRLSGLQPAVGEDGYPRPLVVRLTPEAEAAWERFFNAHAIEQADLTGDLAAAWAKLEQSAARLALVLHYLRWAAGEVRNELLLDRQSMEGGIRLAEWFKQEARRVYATLDETDPEREQRELVEWIERRGGTVTARDVQRGLRRLRGPGAAEAALESLVKAGLGCWEHSPSGQRGQPTRYFRLATWRHGDGDSNAIFLAENTNTVAVAVSPTR